MGRIKRNPQKSCINRVSCPRETMVVVRSQLRKKRCEKGEAGEGGWGHATIQGKKHDKRRFCLAEKRLLSANSSSKSTRFAPLEIRPTPSLCRSFTRRILEIDPRSTVQTNTRREECPKTLGVAVNATVESYISNWANGWHGPDIFRSRTPSERRERRGLCARPSIKKISPAISCKYFPWRSARLLW